jgi:hypothetical protein
MRFSQIVFVVATFLLLSARAPDRVDILTTMAEISGEQTSLSAALSAEEAREASQVSELKVEIAALKRQVCDLEVAAPTSATTGTAACV